MPDLTPFVVLGFALLVSILTGIVFGTVPAWLSSHAEPADALRGIQRSGGPVGDRASLPQRALVVLQVALSVILLAGALLMTKSLRNLELNLKEQGYDLRIMPYVLQLNKRDLPSALPLEEMKRQLLYKGEPVFEAIASKGNGVFETLKTIAKMVLLELRKGR